ncbi:MAG: hypothetical protein ACFFAH_13910 [Promethearchaeota archaeon]
MVFLQLDTTRIIQVYVAQGIVFAIFLFLGYKILKRGKKRLNLMLSCSYLTVVIGFAINFIYAPLTDELIVLILYYMTLFFLFLYPAFLLVFALILLYSEKVVTTPKQLSIILIYAGILFCMVFIPNGVIINASTKWKPVWSLLFFIYVISIITIAVILALYFSLKIYREFEDDKLRKKWKYFIIGLIGIYIFTFGTLLSNTLNIQTVRTIWSYISLILVIISPYLMYYGVGKQIGE